MNLEEVRKHMSQRDHWQLLSDEERHLAHLALADDVPDLVAEVDRLLLQISKIRTAVWAVFSKTTPNNDTPEWRALMKFFELQLADKRYDAKAGKTPPPGFVAAQDPDPKTGHWPGWLAVGDGPEDVWHREAFQREPKLPDGTYELCGPKIQGNPEGFEHHHLVVHGYAQLPAFPRTFDEIKAVFAESDCDIEGVVWHHRDGRMVKIKAKDFGFKRNKK